MSDDVHLSLTTLQHLAVDAGDDAWPAYWAARGSSWRTQPEIDERRQALKVGIAGNELFEGVEDRIGNYEVASLQFMTKINTSRHSKRRHAWNAFVYQLASERKDRT